MAVTAPQKPPRYGVTFAAEMSFENVCLSYGPVETLKGISLSVKPGEILCLLGPSGSGKTSLLRVAAGLERQNSGRILLNGREIAGPGAFLAPEKRSVGLMFQDFALFPHMSVLDNVCFGLANIRRSVARREAEAAI
jgi:iron(III) transport system ATP-binding protein